MKTIQLCLYRRFALAGLVSLFVLLGTACTQYVTVYRIQPEFIKPPKAKTHKIPLRDLEPLAPGPRLKLLENIKAWKLELKQYEETSDLYNREIRKRNEEAKKRLME